MKSLTMALVCLTASILVSGCRTVQPRYLIQVGNYSGQTVTGVQLRVGDTLVHTMADMPDTATFAVPPVQGVVNQPFSLHWVDHDQKSWTEQVDLSRSLNGEFRGSILLEIREEGELKVFTESEERGEEGLMPWNKPESWEGAPTVPGLSP